MHRGAFTVHPETLTHKKLIDVGAFTHKISRHRGFWHKSDKKIAIIFQAETVKAHFVQKGFWTL